MKSRSLAFAALSLVCAFALTAATAHAADSKKPKPDATIKLVSKSVAAGVGISWGSGKLTYKGKTYGLTKIDDFDGNYTAAAAGVTIAGGATGVAMQNQNGVSVRLTSTNKGVNLTIGTGGVKMAIKK